MKFIRSFYKYPIGITIAAIAASALLIGAFFAVQALVSGSGNLSGLEYLPLTFLALAFLTAPVVLTVENLIFLVLKPNPERDRASKSVELFTLFLGTMLCLILIAFTSPQLPNWDEQLYNDALHSPVEPGSLLSAGVVAVIGAIGYLISRFVPLAKQPPLLTVLCIAAMYLGIAESILLCVQMAANPVYLFPCLFPINCVIIALRTVRSLVWQKAELIREQGEPQKLGKFARLLERSSAWPWLALLAALPLLGIIIAVLMLFGQSPDSVIRVWTNTADWTMSQKIAPPNLIRDEHYLCTVAAGGHRKVVKPLRTGKRHGHEVIVNRQLCVANAFEQLLEERTPKFHRAVRGFYDKTGYPIAKHIHSPYLADCIYFIMKPLEWIFLAVLYLFDVKPENRIAVQYPHAPLPQVKK